MTFRKEELTPVVNSLAVHPDFTMYFIRKKKNTFNRRQKISYNQSLWNQTVQKANSCLQQILAKYFFLVFLFQRRLANIWFFFLYDWLIAQAS